MVKTKSAPRCDCWPRWRGTLTSGHCRRPETVGSLSLKTIKKLLNWIRRGFSPIRGPTLPCKQAGPFNISKIHMHFFKRKKKQGYNFQSSSLREHYKEYNKYLFEVPWLQRASFFLFLFFLKRIWDAERRVQLKKILKMSETRDYHKKPCLETTRKRKR